jgi:cytochrome b6-f complex iron-sulfur subunit
MNGIVELSAESVPPLSRREFLYYIWGASMVVLMTGVGGAALWFLLPRFRAGEFGGVFTLSIDEVPALDSPPAEFAEGRFWLVNLGSQTLSDTRHPTDYPLQPGIRALYKVCTHLGCLYKWVATNDRFECPCHGSKYLKTGARTDGPARRNLDLFMIEVLDKSGEVLTRTEPSLGGREGTSVQLAPEGISLRVDTGRRVLGATNSKKGGGI